MPEGAVVVFSAHGIAPEVSEAAQRKLRPSTPTCPLVTKVHNEARRFARKDYDILLIGHAGHEEVVGTTGEAPDRIRLVDGPDAVADIEVRDPAQDRLAVPDDAVGGRDGRDGRPRCEERFPNLLDPPSDDICYATQNRQAAVKLIAAGVGSGDRRRLAQLVELGPPGRGRQGTAPGPPTWSTTRARSTRPGWTTSRRSA